MAKDRNKNKPQKNEVENLNGDVATITPPETVETSAPEAPPSDVISEAVETPTEAVQPEVVESQPTETVAPSDPLAILQNARMNAERERNEVLAQIAKLDQESTALHARLATINAALGVPASKIGGKRSASGTLGDDAQTILGKMVAGATYTYKDLGGMIASITQYPYHAITQLVASGKVEKLGRSQYRLAAVATPAAS